LFEVYRRNSASRVTRCRVREDDIECDWSAWFVLRVCSLIIGSCARHLAPSLILVQSRIPSHAQSFLHNIRNLQPQDDDLWISKLSSMQFENFGKVGWLDADPRIASTMIDMLVDYSNPMSNHKCHTICPHGRHPIRCLDDTLFQTRLLFR
jgi:hypothetical protein